jgi:hypothetical protein
MSGESLANWPRLKDVQDKNLFNSELSYLFFIEMPKISLIGQENPVPGDRLQFEIYRVEGSIPLQIL